MKEEKKNEEENIEITQRELAEALLSFTHYSIITWMFEIINKKGWTDRYTELYNSLGYSIDNKYSKAEVFNALSQMIVQLWWDILETDENRRSFIKDAKKMSIQASLEKFNNLVKEKM